MFRSRRRALVYSQYEHARLAGALAERWGNVRFPRPPLPFDAFAAGVALHDFGYGVLDTHPIGEMDRPERLAILAALVDARLADPVAETVALLHARRLIADVDAALAERCERRIATLLDRTGVDRAAHEAADRITDLCDSVAFHFCFEHAHAGRVRVPTLDGPGRRSDGKRESDAGGRAGRGGRADDVERIGDGADSRGAHAADETGAVEWTLDPDGQVTLSPWPLDVPALDVRVIAYDAAGYPDALVPHAVLCRVRPG